MTAIPDSQPTLSIRPATPADIPSIKSMIHAAYSKYIPRIGRPPAPMLTDYDALLADATQQLYVLRASPDDASAILGSIQLSTEADTTMSAAALKINSLVVDPSAQGRGYGRFLMEFAEGVARSQGCSAMILFTNVMMWENLVLYGKLGFVERERKVEDGYERVYFRKELDYGGK
ncbi:hypothetical protein OHC33_007542 [Knufia fluminis]|uniref:N-acetyltransferase domain-containing protein n=1 Tax=Knufia fluminis TaxID=191047 RepID=A0AAN8I688_9EURO|nr:hypothetical protein OHC33_007542 [Knufia fluminis]